MGKVNTESTQITMRWELIETQGTSSSHMSGQIRRTELPDGWLVETRYDFSYRNNVTPNGGLGMGTGLTYVPDPNKMWQPKILGIMEPTV